MAAALHGLAEGTQPADAGSAKPVFEKRSGAILLVEDNQVNQLVAQRMLERRGYSVTTASNGAEAVELFRALAPDLDRPDLILMDVQMPGMDGFEATAAIREIELARGGRVPIVALTANAMKGDRERCLEAGMNGYLAKPLERRDLYDTLDCLLGAPVLVA